MSSSDNVDTTSISPTIGPLERRNSLEKHLVNRPEAQDLKNRHILLDTNAAPYVGFLVSFVNCYHTRTSTQ
jgi:hypothetical protein